MYRYRPRPTLLNSQAGAKTVYTKAFDDLQARTAQLPNLYSPSAQIVHNGTTILGSAVQAFFSTYPPTQTEVQSLDAHAVAGS